MNLKLKLNLISGFGLKADFRSANSASFRSVSAEKPRARAQLSVKSRAEQEKTGLNRSWLPQRAASRITHLQPCSVHQELQLRLVYCFPVASFHCALHSRMLPILNLHSRINQTRHSAPMTRQNTD